MQNFVSARGFITLASFSLFAVAGAQSLQPIDPLQRPKTGAGSSSFSVSAGYNPDVTAAGVQLGVGLGLTAAYNVTEQFAVTASTGGGIHRAETLNEDGTVNVNSGVGWNGLSVGGQYTFGGKYAPTLGLDIALPIGGNSLAVTGSASASLLRDPVILDGTLAYTYRPTASTLSAGAGVGFVVNDAVTLRGDAIQSLTFGKLTVPSTTIGLGGAYKLNEKHSLTARTTLNVVAGQTSTGFSLSYLYRP